MNNLKIYLMNVGQGESSLIVFPNGKTMLIDCYVNCEEELNYIPFLESSIPDSYDEEVEALVKRIDYMVITHPDLDHIKGISEIFKRFDVNELCDNGYTYDNDTEDYKDYLEIRKVYKENGKYVVLRANSECFTYFDLGGAVVNVLSPVRKDDDINDDSVVLKIEYSGNSILFTGDSSYSVWQDKIMPLFKDDVECTVLQASHHGSRSFFMDTSIEDYEINDFYTDHLKAISSRKKGDSYFFRNIWRKYGGIRDTIPIK